MIKRFIILMLIAGSCSADVILGSISDGYTYSSFDANNVVISFGSVAPSGILEFEWLFAAGDATDTSGNSNDGTIIGMVNVPLTNGLASHFDMADATNTMSATMGSGIESVCWWGNSNGTWRYYESIGGTQRVNNATEAYTASDWFTTNGTAFNFGGSAFDVAQARGYNTVIDNIVSMTNRVELGSNLGIISDYLADNTSTYWQDTAETYGFNNIIQSGVGGTNATSSAFTLDGTASNGWAIASGSTFLNCGDNAQINTAESFTVSCWVNPQVPTRGDYVTIWQTAAGSEKFNLLQGIPSGTFDFYVATDRGFEHTGAVPFSTGQWYFLTAVYDNNGIALYTNGVMGATNSVGNIDLNTDGLPLLIGKNVNGYNVNALIDEVSVFSRAFSYSEITNQYQTSKTETGF